MHILKGIIYKQFLANDQAMSYTYTHAMMSEKLSDEHLFRNILVFEKI
jgi:hypothetical protein